MRYKTRELAHAWVHQLSHDGKCPAAESFDGDAYYSYSTVIARRLRNRKGETAYLLNTHRFSVSTTRHQAHVSRAIPSDARVFHTYRGINSSLILSPRELYEECMQRAGSARVAGARARKRKDFWAEAEHAALTEAAAVSRFYGMRRRPSEAAVSRLVAAVGRERKRTAKLRAEDQARRERDNADAVREWLEGEPRAFPSEVERVYLRVYAGQVETSRGAWAPLADVHRAYRFALLKRAEGWRRNGETCPVGDFQIDSISEAGVIAGCHRISWEEIERFAKTQSWDLLA